MGKRRSILRLPAEEKESPRQWFLDIACTLAGTMLYAIAVHVFLAQNHIPPGGISGISTIINYLTLGMVQGGLPIGAVNFVLNIPIIILGFLKLGRHFMIKTLVSLGSFVLFQDVILKPVPVYTDNRLVAAIFAGVIAGAGIGLIMHRGGSSGGTDIVNKIIQRRVPHMKIGQVVFASNLIVVALSIPAYQNVEPGLFAIIALYIQSMALDKVLYGFTTCKFMYIVTEKTEEMAHRINSDLHRGATILESYGSYTNQRRPTVMVAVRQNEYYRIRKIIDSTDPDCFVIVTPATEIMGKGFTRAGPYDKKK